MAFFLAKSRKIRTFAEIWRDIAPRYFHGNVRAQFNRIITEEDVEKRRNKIANYTF
jgi:hypothetical protein